VNDIGTAKINFPKVAIIILNWNEVLKLIEVAIQSPYLLMKEKLSSNYSMSIMIPIILWEFSKK
jgi:hypothetical protein